MTSQNIKPEYINYCLDNLHFYLPYFLFMAIRNKNEDATILKTRHAEIANEAGKLLHACSINFNQGIRDGYHYLEYTIENQKTSLTYRNSDSLTLTLIFGSLDYVIVDKFFDSLHSCKTLALFDNDFDDSVDNKLGRDIFIEEAILNAQSLSLVQLDPGFNKYLLKLCLSAFIHNGYELPATADRTMVTFLSSCLILLEIPHHINEAEKSNLKLNESKGKFITYNIELNSQYIYEKAKKIAHSNLSYLGISFHDQTELFKDAKEILNGNPVRYNHYKHLDLALVPAKFFKADGLKFNNLQNNSFDWRTLNIRTHAFAFAAGALCTVAFAAFA